jgi:aminoglycoside phosphotransferase (APT) family kinase protein
MPVWDADTDINEGLVRSLLGSQFPSLPISSLRLVGEGWDNAAYLVNEDWLFRFPRRRMGEGLILTECRLLPLLADLLPLPVPKPEFFGRPGGSYPYPFAGYRFLDGTPACHLNWTEAQRAENAGILGGFLGRLHAVPVDEAAKVWAPKDEIRRSEMAYRYGHMQRFVDELGPALGSFDPASLLSLAEELSHTSAYAGPEHWVHGDAYSCHFLADDQHRICGVIDWGDAHLGDPALDISIAFGFLPPSGRETFIEAYGGIDEATLRRARFRALHYGLVFIKYGTQGGKPDMLRIGQDAIRLAMHDHDND